jgi:hypothetical protein
VVLQKPSLAKHSHVWSGVCVMLSPGQQASHLHFGESHFGQSVLQRLVVGRRYGGVQKPMEAKHMHALFSGGQHDGHSWPGVYFGSSPGGQKPSLAKHAHSLCGVCVMFCPGQHESHLQSGVVQPGQRVEQRECVGSFGGGARAVLSAAEVAAAAAQRAPRARLTEYMLLLLELVVDEVWQESSGTAANRGLKTFRPHTSAVMPPQPPSASWIYYMIIVVY